MIDQGRALESSDMTAAAPGSVLLTLGALGSPPRAPPHAQPPPPTRRLAQPQGAQRRGARVKRGPEAGTRGCGRPRLPRLRVPQSPAQPTSRPRPPRHRDSSFHPALPLSSRPPPEPQARAKLSLLPPPADAQRADVITPGKPGRGPPPPAAILSVAGRGASEKGAGESGGR